jgi:hypothetical protein
MVSKNHGLDLKKIQDDVFFILILRQKYIWLIHDLIL